LKHLGYYGPPTAFAFAGYARGLRQGQLHGFRKRVISNVSSTIDKAKLKLQYKGMDKAAGLSSAGRKPVDLTKVRALTDPKQMTAFKTAMASAEMKPYLKRLVLAGSASQTTYIGGSAHDIDLHVKTGFPRPKFVKTQTTFTPGAGETTGGWKLTWHRPSYAPRVQSIFAKFGVGTGVVDIHDLARPGTPFSVLGTGLSQKPIRTAKGSIFKWQSRLSEQAGRKFAQTIAPEHLGRGKDWPAALTIAEKTFGDPKYVAALKGWQPTLEPGTKRLAGPSYFDSHPTAAPKAKFTPFERLIRKYGAPLTTADLYAPGTDWKIEAQSFRPTIMAKPAPTPTWAKGRLFLASLGAPSFSPTKGSASPIFIGMPSFGPSTTFPSVGRTLTLPSSYGPSPAPRKQAAPYPQPVPDFTPSFIPKPSSPRYSPPPPPDFDYTPPSDDYDFPPLPDYPRPPPPRSTSSPPPYDFYYEDVPKMSFFPPPPKALLRESRKPPSKEFDIFTDLDIFGKTKKAPWGDPLKEFEKLGDFQTGSRKRASRSRRRVG
jgi:hypothetical protein